MSSIPRIIEENDDYYASWSGYGSGNYAGYSQSPYYSTSYGGSGSVGSTGGSGMGTSGTTSGGASIGSSSSMGYTAGSGTTTTTTATTTSSTGTTGGMGTTGGTATLPTTAAQCKMNGLTAADMLQKGISPFDLLKMGFTQEEIERAISDAYGVNSPLVNLFRDLNSQLLMGSGVDQTNLARLLAEESDIPTGSGSGSGSSMNSAFQEFLNQLSGLLGGGSGSKSGSSGLSSLNTPSSTSSSTSTSATSSSTLTNTLNAKTKPQCDTTNNICSFESFTSRSQVREGYRGNSSISALNAIVSSTSNSRWMASDKYFNMGFNEIAVASVYNRVIKIDQPIKFTIYTTNQGYLFVNDFMYLMNKEVKSGSGIYMIENVTLGSLNQDNYIYLLLPGNSAILCNDAPLYTNTSWRSIAFDLNQAFKDADPIQFGLNNIKSRVVSIQEVVYPLTSVPVTLNVQRAPSSQFICNSAVYQTYTADQLKADKEVKTIRFTPLNPITVDSANFVANFQVFSSNNNFKVYSVSASSSEPIIRQVNKDLIFNTQQVNPNLAVYSQSMEYSLDAGKNFIVVVAPEKSFIYIPMCSVINKATRATLALTTSVNPYITDSNWRYKVIRIPYYQFDYPEYAGVMDKDLFEAVRPAVRESFRGQRQQKTQVEGFGNRREHFNDTIYSELGSGILEEEYIHQSERRRREMRNMKESLNSDDKFDIAKLRENAANTISSYFDTLIDNYAAYKRNEQDNTKEGSLAALSKTYTDLNVGNGAKIVTKYNGYLKNNSTDPSIQEIEKKKAELGDPQELMMGMIGDLSKMEGLEQIKRQNSTSVATQMDKIATQLNILTTAISSNKPDVIEKEYSTYLNMLSDLNTLLANMEPIQAEYARYYNNIMEVLPNAKSRYQGWIALINGDMKRVVDTFDKAADDKRSIQKYIDDATTLLSKAEFVMTNSECPLKVFEANVKDNTADYNKTYNDTLTGFKAKVQNIIDTHMKMTKEIKDGLLVDISTIKSADDIDSFISKIDFSAFWNNAAGSKAIDDFKKNLKEYMTAYFNVVSGINTTFSKSYTALTTAMFDEIKNIIAQNVNTMNDTYSTEKTDYENKVNTAKGILEKMKREQNSQTVSVMKGYYDSISDTYTTLSGKKTAYKTFSEDMIKKYNTPFKDMTEKIVLDTFNTRYENNKSNLSALSVNLMGTKQIYRESFENRSRTPRGTLDPRIQSTQGNLATYAPPSAAYQKQERIKQAAYYQGRSSIPIPSRVPAPVPAPFALPSADFSASCAPVRPSWPSRKQIAEEQKVAGSRRSQKSRGGAEHFQGYQNREDFTLKSITKPIFDGMQKPMPVEIKTKTTKKEKRLRQGYTVRTGNVLKITFKGDIGPENMVMRATYDDNTSTLFNYNAIGTSWRTIYYELPKKMINLYIGFTNDSIHGGDRNIRFSEITYNFTPIMALASRTGATDSQLSTVRRGMYPWSLGFDYGTRQIAPVEFAAKYSTATPPSPPTGTNVVNPTEILSKDKAMEDYDVVTENTYNSTPLEKAAIWVGGVNPGSKDMLSFVGLLYLTGTTTRSGYLQLSLSNLDKIEAVYFNLAPLTKSGDRYNIASITPNVYHFVQIIIRTKVPSTNNNFNSALNASGVANVNSYLSAILYENTTNAVLLTTRDDTPDQKSWKYSFMDVAESFSNYSQPAFSTRPLSEEAYPVQALPPRPMVRQVPAYQSMATIPAPNGRGFGSSMGWGIQPEESNLKLAYAYRYEED